MAVKRNNVGRFTSASGAAGAVTLDLSFKNPPEEFIKLAEIADLDLTVTMRELSRDLIADVDEHYVRQLGSAGPFAPLSPAYAKRKAKKHPGKRILEATGGYRDSWISEEGKLSAAVTSTSPLDKFHEGRGPRAKMPFRDVAWIGPRRAKDIVDRTADALLKAFAKMGAD